MGFVKAGSKGTLGAAPAEPAAEEDWIALLDDPAADRRRRAARALGDRPDAAAALAARLAREEDAAVREAVLTALVRIGSPEAAAGLVPMLASEDAGLRNGALESLQQMPAGSVEPQMDALSDSADSDLRIFAVLLAARLGPAERSARLHRALERDPHVNVGLTAAEAVAELGDPAALPALEAFAARFPDDACVAFTVDAARRRFRGAS